MHRPHEAIDRHATDVLHALFGTSGAVSWAHESARAVLVFVYGLALVRIAGRRVFARRSALDIVVSIIVVSNLSRVLTRQRGAVVNAARHHAADGAAPRPRSCSGALARRVAGARGHFDRPRQQRCGRQRLADAPCDQRGRPAGALRSAGVEAAGETRLVALEPSGKISVLKPG